MIQYLNDQYTKADSGCLATLRDCLDAVAAGDPGNLGLNATANRACANVNCPDSAPFGDWTGRNVYDISQSQYDPFPPPFFLGYLNKPFVQHALGVPINFTMSIDSVFKDFSNTGDVYRSGQLADLARLLDAGVRVALVYGDRDWICNWMGGENVSLHVPYQSQDAFRAAGYANLTNGTDTSGGLTREAGNFSFSRVFQAGHEVPAYQPEVALAIFNRSIHQRDIATGAVDLLSDAKHATTGPNDTLAVRQRAPAMAPSTCYLLDLSSTCDPDQAASVLDGSGTVRNYILIDGNHTDTFPDARNDTIPEYAPTATPSATGSAPAASSSKAAASRVGAWDGGYLTTLLPVVTMLVAVLAGAAVL